MSSRNISSFFEFLSQLHWTFALFVSNESRCLCECRLDALNEEFLKDYTRILLQPVHDMYFLTADIAISGSKSENTLRNKVCKFKLYYSRKFPVLQSI